MKETTTAVYKVVGVHAKFTNVFVQLDKRSSIGVVDMKESDELFVVKCVFLKGA